MGISYVGVGATGNSNSGSSLTIDYVSTSGNSLFLSIVTGATPTVSDSSDSNIWTVLANSSGQGFLAYTLNVAEIFSVTISGLSSFGAQAVLGEYSSTTGKIVIVGSSISNLAENENYTITKNPMVSSSNFLVSGGGTIAVGDFTAGPTQGESYLRGYIVRGTGGSYAYLTDITGNTDLTCSVVYTPQTSVNAFYAVAIEIGPRTDATASPSGVSFSSGQNSPSPSAGSTVSPLGQNATFSVGNPEAYSISPLPPCGKQFGYGW